MNKKELIQLIKDKADQVEIKDFSKAIIEKAKSLPLQEKIIKKPFFNFKPVSLISALTVSFLVVMAFLLTNNQTPVYAFNDMDQVLVDSSITSLSLIEEDNTMIQSDQMTTLSLDLLDTELIVDTEIDEVLRYLQATERLLSDYTYQKTSNQNQYDYRLTFETTDLLDDTNQYQLYYNETKVSKNQLNLEGEISLNGNSYSFEANVQLGEKNQLSMNLSSSDGKSIQLTYQYKGENYQYAFDYFEQNVKIQSIEMRKFMLNGQNRLMLDFKEGNASGTYAFSVEQNGTQKRMRGQYIISGQTSEDGQLIIEASEEDTYQIEIQPSNGQSTVIERGRRSNQPTGNRPF